MPRIPEEIIDEIRNRVDIVDVVGSYVTSLKKRGSEYWGCCPFHKEKTPSFKVNSNYQSYKCFGCGKSGSVFGFVQDIENMGFLDAVRLLARRAGVQIPENDPHSSPEEQQSRRDERERGAELLAAVAQWYRGRLRAPDARAARLYLHSRGIDKEAADTFCIGYAPDSFDATSGWVLQQGYSMEDLVNTGLVSRSEEHPERPPYDRFRGRVMFAIHDHLGRVVGFSGRVLDAEAKTAKYVNSPETAFFHKSQVLYGLHLARQSFTDAGCALVCEGQLDVIACHRAGFTHAICAQGTAFTEDHVRRLRRSTQRVLLAFDADTAGRKAALRSIELCHAAEISVGVIALPQGEDPDSIFRSGGVEGMREVFSRVTEAIPYAFACARQEGDSTTPEGMNRVVQQVLSLVVPIPTPVTRIAHARWLARALSLPEEPVVETLNRMVSRRNMTESGSWRGGRENREPPGMGGPPAFVPPPPMLAPSNEDVALCMLLELSLLSATAGQEVACRLPVELIDETPVGEALNLVLAHTEEGEWGDVVVELRRRDDLLANPDIARIIHTSAHDQLNPEAYEENERPKVLERLQKAVADCVVQLRLRDLDREILANQQAQAVAGDADEARRLQREHLQLVMDKQKLRREIG